MNVTFSNAARVGSRVGAHQAFLSQVRFRGPETPPPGDKPPTDKPAEKPEDKDAKKPARAFNGWELALFKPLSAVVSFVMSHPKIVSVAKDKFSPTKKLFEGCFLDAKHHHHFGPIKEVSFKSVDGIPLQGYWMQSENPSADKTVILGHGYTDDWRTMMQTAHNIRKAGYNCLLFDFRAHGKSGGKQCKLGLEEARDIAGAVNYLTKNSLLAPKAKSLFYMGHSMGAASMMMAPKSLAGYPDDMAHLIEKLDGMILDSPYASLHPKNVPAVGKVMDKSVPDALKGVAQYLLDGLAEKMMQDAKGTLGTEITEIVPAEVLSKHALMKKPMLLIHGSEDIVTPYAHAEEIQKILKAAGAEIELLKLEGEDHYTGDTVPVKAGEKPVSFMTVQRGGAVYTEGIKNFLEKHKKKAIQFAGSFIQRKSA